MEDDKNISYHELLAARVKRAEAASGLTIKQALKYDPRLDDLVYKEPPYAGWIEWKVWQMFPDE